jgi:protein tyrosine phosphatase (PTP) superfamily phosphohydrolase (DUF442 family)
MTADLANILNYLPVSPTLGTSGQPTRDQFPPIAAAGYQVLVNLALPSSDGALADEGAIATRLGMAYVHIPVVWERPERSQFALFSSVLAGAGDRPVFVHCAMNMRVSVFVYLDRVIRLAVPEAIARADLHRIWTPNPVWATFIQTVLATHSPDPTAP